MSTQPSEKEHEHTFTAIVGEILLTIIVASAIISVIAGVLKLASNFF